MSNKKIIIIISILFSILLIFIIYKSITKKEAYFKNINFIESQYVSNKTKYEYLDTIVHAGLQVLNIDTVYILIRPMSILNQKIDIDEDFETVAFIMGEGRQYLIYISDASRERHIKIISHELIHLKQYYNKELIKTNNKNIIIWKGDSLNILDYSYKNRQWEIEAFSNEDNISNEIKKILY